MALAGRGKKKYFDVNKTTANTRQDAYGIRQGLFRASAEVDVSVLNTLSLDAERAIALALYKRGQLARNEARRNVRKMPRNNTRYIPTGALEAGIYITAPATKAELSQMRATGKPIAAHKTKSHSSSYARAIAAAGRRTDTIDEDGTRREGLRPFGASQFNGNVFARTQRFVGEKSGSRTLKDLRNDIDGLGNLSDSQILTAFNMEAPFVGLGDTGRGAFYIGLGSAMYYSAWVEFGTSKMKARPFFSGPANAFAKDAQAIISKAFKEAASGKRTIRR